MEFSFFIPSWGFLKCVKVRFCGTSDGQTRWRRRRRRTEHRWNLKISSCAGRSRLAQIIMADRSMGPKPYLPPPPPPVDIGLLWSHVQNLILSTTFLKPCRLSLLDTTLRWERGVWAPSLSSFSSPATALPFPLYLPTVLCSLCLPSRGSVLPSPLRLWL